MNPSKFGVAWHNYIFSLHCKSYQTELLREAWHPFPGDSREREGGGGTPLPRLGVWPRWLHRSLPGSCSVSTWLWLLGKSRVTSGLREMTNPRGTGRKSPSETGSLLVSDAWTRQQRQHLADAELSLLRLVSESSGPALARLPSLSSLADGSQGAPLLECPAVFLSDFWAELQNR